MEHHHRKQAHKQMDKHVLHKLEAAAAAELAPEIPRENVLSFSLVRQVLWGRIGTIKYGPVAAYSGAGQTGVEKINVKYGNWAPTKEKSATSRGGCLVPGWWIVIPEKLAKGHQSSHVRWGAAPTDMSLRIVPYKLEDGYHDSMRTSFYIHGTGGHGSDGCILVDPTNRRRLVHLICSKGGAWLRAFVSDKELHDKFKESLESQRTS